MIRKVGGEGIFSMTYQGIDAVWSGLLNAAQFAQGLGVDGKTVARYLDLLVDLLVVFRRRLHQLTGR